MIFIVFFSVIFTIASAGFCDKKYDGWHCDSHIAKQCRDGNKVSETRCDYKCSSGSCRDAYFCEERKIPSIQELSWCRAIVSYSVDKNTNVPVSDSNAKSYAELLQSFRPTPTTSPQPTVVNGTTQTTTTQDTTTPAFDCDTAYQRFSCFKEFINCGDRSRPSCKLECDKTNQCNVGGTQIDCDKSCSASTIMASFSALIAIVLVAVVVF